VYKENKEELKGKHLLTKYLTSKPQKITKHFKKFIRIQVTSINIKTLDFNPTFRPKSLIFFSTEDVLNAGRNHFAGISPCRQIVLPTGFILPTKT
jgi:hypothetical protein